MVAEDASGKVDGAITIIRNGIINGRLVPNEEVTGKAVQEEFDLSRSTALEVLRRLELEGYIERLPPYKFRVRYYPAGEIYTRFITLISLEAEAASMLASRITTSEVKTLRGLLAQMKQLGGSGSVDLDKLIGLLRDFRAYQLSLLNARPMAEAIATAAQPAFLRMAGAVQTPDDLRRGREQLESLVDAYEQNNAMWASAVVRASYYPLMHKLMERAGEQSPRAAPSRLREILSGTRS